MSKVSILMTVYNGAKYLDETMRDVLAQTYQDYEFIIIDDGSTDGTASVLSKYSDSRIRIHTLEKNLGVGKAGNYGLEQCSGEYVFKVDADDRYDLAVLEKQVRHLEENPDLDLSKTLVRYFPDSLEVKSSVRFQTFKNIIEGYYNRVIASEELREKLYWYCCVPNSSIIVRSEVVKKFGYNDFRHGEDYDLFYRMNKAGHKMGTVNEVLLHNRISKTSITATLGDEYHETVYRIKEEEIQAMIRNRPDTEIFVWGAGSAGRAAVKILEKNHIAIAGFIDSDEKKQGTFLDGKAVCSFEGIEPKKILVFVASQPGLYEIVERLQSCGMTLMEDYIIYR